MLEFVYRTLSRVLQMLLNGGESPHSFGNTTVNIIYGKQKLAVDKEDLLVFEDGETKAGLMREPQILPRLNVYEVDVHQAVNIINKARCGPTHDVFEDNLFYDPLRVSDVRWNYEVFLVNKQGYPAYRFSEDAPMTDIETAVKGLLQSPIVESTFNNEIPVYELEPEPVEEPAEENEVE